jgi:hypothetical protein
MTEGKALSPVQAQELLQTLQTRFERNATRHEGITWPVIQTRLLAQPEKLWSLGEMERTGGEPDMVGYDMETNEYLFFDCSAESPVGRRNLCYDQEALNTRKENKPQGSAMVLARAMGVEILTEQQYSTLQKLGSFDTKTSSWVATPSAIRKLGGALFGDRRYGHVFIYHNGAESYYAVRGYRGCLRIEA